MVEEAVKGENDNYEDLRKCARLRFTFNMRQISNWRNYFCPRIIFPNKILFVDNDKMDGLNLSRLSCV